MAVLSRIKVLQLHFDIAIALEFLSLSVFMHGGFFLLLMSVGVAPSAVSATKLSSTISYLDPLRARSSRWFSAAARPRSGRCPHGYAWHDCQYQLYAALYHYAYSKKILLPISVVCGEYTITVIRKKYFRGLCMFQWFFPCCTTLVQAMMMQQRQIRLQLWREY
jgi:hypothetical protein